jgi:uncharacterized membrane protein YeaQ/YmgE (transglycosylase-associated protein family)
VYVLSDSIVATFRRGASGSLSQPPDQHCFSADGSGGECSPLPLLDGAIGLAISRDGRNLYVASVFSGAIVIFRREPATGRLTRLPGSAGCVSAVGTAEGCALGVGLDGVANVAVAPDGENVYAVSPYHDAVLSFSRAASGALTPLPEEAACVSAGDDEGCTRGDMLTRASALAVSPDGRNVYVTSVEPIGSTFVTGQELGSLTVFARHAPTTVSLGTPTATRLHAGTSFTVATPVRTTTDAVSVRCTATAGATPLRVRARYENGVARCIGVIPKAAEGKLLIGTVTATTAGASATKRFSFAVRQRPAAQGSGRSHSTGNHRGFPTSGMGEVSSMVAHIIGLILVGLVVGALGRLFHRGRDPMGLLLTIGIGVASVLIAGLLIGGWLGFVLAVVIGVLLVSLWPSLMARRQPRWRRVLPG